MSADDPHADDPHDPHDYGALAARIASTYALDLRGPHGCTHWARVQENGLRIASQSGADPVVVKLFALFHDSCRLNDKRDPDHGPRGAELARCLRGTLVHLDEARFALLQEACTRHTIGTQDRNPTIGACWDADRLDLARVGIFPTSDRLSTEVGRGMIAWANERAIAGHVATEVLEGWGLRSEGSADTEAR
jgi:uncharacterized protein